MDDPLCRVSIQSATQPRVVDLVLPRHAEVGLLLPDIVDLVAGDEASAVASRGWRLDRLRGGHCDESMTLHFSMAADPNRVAEERRHWTANGIGCVVAAIAVWIGFTRSHLWLSKPAASLMQKSPV